MWRDHSFAELASSFAFTLAHSRPLWRFMFFWKRACNVSSNSSRSFSDNFFLVSTSFMAVILDWCGVHESSTKPFAPQIPFAPLYLDRSRNARPLPFRLYRPCRSPHLLHSCFLIETPSLPTLGRCFPSQRHLDHSHCLVLAPATLTALPSTHAIETRSLSTSLAATHRGFAFYVAFPKSSIPDRGVFYVANPIRSIPTSLPVAVCKSSFCSTLSTLRATQPFQARIIDQPFLPSPLAGCTGPSR